MFYKFMEMEEEQERSSLSELGQSDATWWPSDFVEGVHSLTIASQEERSSIMGRQNPQHGELSAQTASQTLWSTGSYSRKIPNGFYVVFLDRKLKTQFNIIPPLDELLLTDMAGLRDEIILVDAEKDKKLSMLKQLSMALVKGHHSNPASVIKKIAELVSDFYKRPLSELCSAKSFFEETSQLPDNKGVLLGQIRQGSCRPRAILFKVLADSVGLESKLMMGIPNDGTVEYMDSYKHLSVVVVLNSVDFLVDLVRFPGQLIPFSTKALLTSHIFVEGESDSAENDSCDSPLEPNSPLCGASDSHDQEENFQSNNQQRAGASNVGSSQHKLLQPIIAGKLSSSYSESNITNAFWRRSRRKAVIEQRTTSSSPEHPLLRARGRSILGADRHSFREFSAGVAISRSDGSSAGDTRKIRRRSISVTPEIGDDIVMAVRAMNDTLKQSRILRNRGYEDAGACSVDKNILGALSNNTSVSLPSSPHEFIGGMSEISGPADLSARSFFSTWNKVLQSSSLINQPLIPFDEWNIDFLELTVGTRVGIGSFGEVFRGTWNGTDVAIKVFLEQDLTVENLEDFCNEISILSRLRHPNVILFLGACMKPPHLSMVTEYMEMGSLYHLIHTSGLKKKLSWRRKLKMLRDICRGLMCIHRMKIVHRDLKSANCLVDKHWTIKICDFGLSRMMTDASIRDSSSAGTPEWMSPELIRNEPFTEKCDIFSLGVIIWELCTLNRPWEGTPPAQVVYAVANEGTRLEIPEGPLGKIIADCWADPDDRPSCQEILSRLLDCENTLC